MSSQKADTTVRVADASDAGAIARLLHDFNLEFDCETPGVEFLARRVAELIESGEIEVLLGGEGPDGVAVRRLRPALWADGLDAYLEELYVVPERRGGGLGRALLNAVVERARAAGAVHLDLCTGEGDTAARGLYESAGFTNVEEGTEADRMLYYECDL